jgi:hypothetical protein
MHRSSKSLAPAGAASALRPVPWLACCGCCCDPILQLCRARRAARRRSPQPCGRCTCRWQRGLAGPRRTRSAPRLMPTLAGEVPVEVRLTMIVTAVWLRTAAGRMTESSSSSRQTGICSPTSGAHVRVSETPCGVCGRTAVGVRVQQRAPPHARQRKRVRHTHAVVHSCDAQRPAQTPAMPPVGAHAAHRHMRPDKPAAARAPLSQRERAHSAALQRRARARSPSCAACR